MAKSSDVKVLLQRRYVTKRGIFEPGEDGSPVSIPKGVVAQFGLPKTAVIVSEDYVPPKERKKAEANETVEMTAARMEEEIRRRAEERAEEIYEARKKSRDKVEEPEDEEDQDEEEDQEEEDFSDLDAILSGSVKNATAQMEDLDHDQLAALLDKEKEGRNRASMIAEIEAAIEDLSDSTG